MESVAPCFVVGNLAETLNYDHQRLGFDTAFVVPEEAPFFAVVQGGLVQILLKQIAPDVLPTPNSTRHA